MENIEKIREIIFQYFKKNGITDNFRKLMPLFGHVKSYDPIYRAIFDYIGGEEKALEFLNSFFSKTHDIRDEMFDLRFTVSFWDLDESTADYVKKDDFTKPYMTIYDITCNILDTSTVLMDGITYHLNDFTRLSLEELNDKYGFNPNLEQEYEDGFDKLSETIWNEIDDYFYNEITKKIGVPIYDIEVHTFSGNIAESKRMLNTELKRIKQLI